MNNRTQIPDLLKGIAVLLMIQVHIIELFATSTIYTSIVGKLLLFLGGPFIAPIFIFFLGYFLMASKKSMKQLMVRGLQLFFLGMCLNVLLNLNLIISVNRGVLNVDIWPYIFGVDILQFAGLSTILIVVLKKIVSRSYLISVFLILLSAFLGHYLLHFIPSSIYIKYISAFFYGSTTWSYFPLFPWLAYPLAGVFFFQIEEKFTISKLQNGLVRVIAFILFLLFLMSTLMYAIRVSSNLQSYYHHGILFTLWTLLFLGFYSYFMNEINNLFGQSFILRYIKWLGENVTVIYVLQWIIIGNMATAVYKTMASPLYLLVSFIGIVLVSSALCFVYLKIRQSNKELHTS